MLSERRKRFIPPAIVLSFMDMLDSKCDKQSRQHDRLGSRGTLWKKIGVYLKE
jgi:hypothetical protein